MYNKREFCVFHDDKKGMFIVVLLSLSQIINLGNLKETAFLHSYIMC